MSGTHQPKRLDVNGVHEWAIANFNDFFAANLKRKCFIH